MNPIFEYSDTLNNPYEAFFFDAQKNNFPVSPHWHYFMEILYILKGTAYIETDTDNYVLEPGDLIVFHPQTPHAIYAAGPFPLQYQVLKFDPILTSAFPVFFKNPSWSIFPYIPCLIQ